MNFCPKCGAKTSSGHQFCTACGASVEAPTEEIRPESLLGHSPPPRISRPSSALSVWRVALGVILGIGILWVFFPGIFDSRSPSLLGSEQRRSPLVDMVGPKTVFDDSVNIKEDQYYHYTFELKVPATVSLSVTREKGPKFEVFVLEQSDLDEFKKGANSLFGGEFHHFKDFAGAVDGKHPSHHRRGALKAGTYVALIDNTDFGTVSPPANFADDAVTARVKVVVE